MSLEPWIEHDKRRKSWCVRWRDAAGGKHRDDISFRDKDSATQRKKKIWDDLEKNALGKLDETRTPKQCTDAFIVEHGALVTQERVDKTYVAAFKRFLLIGGMPTMRDVNRQRLLDYKASLVANNLAGSTIGSYMNVMKVWLRWAVSREWISKNPYVDIVVKKPQQIDRYLTDAEIDLMEAHIRNEEFRCIFRLVYMAGLRPPQEVLRIQSVERIWNEAKKVWMLRVAPDETKTNTGRTVVLEQKIIDVWPDRPGKVFSEWNNQRINRHFNKTKQRAGIVDKMIKRGNQMVTVFKTIYWGRHTYARQFLERGGDMRVLSLLMGHSGIKVTVDTYGHLEHAYVVDHVATLETRKIAPQMDTTHFGGAMAGHTIENGVISGHRGTP